MGENILRKSSASINVLVDPDDTDKDGGGIGATETQETEEILPKWAYGAIAGGLVALAGVAITVGHFISRRRRQKQAEEYVRQMSEQFITEEKVTPRGTPENPVDLNDL